MTEPVIIDLFGAAGLISSVVICLFVVIFPPAAWDVESVLYH